MTSWLWLIVSLVGLWVSVIWAFVATMHAKALNESGTLTLFWKVHILPLALIGVVLDFAFNMTFGTIMFREVPHELLFTSRVKRHFRESNGRRLRLAGFWRTQLNLMDPGHVK